MNRLRRVVRAILVILGVVILVGIGLQAVNWVSYRLLRGRLEPLYAIAGGVRKGMPRDQVLRLISENESPHLSRHDFPNGDMTLWVVYSMMDVCSTAMHFADGRLESTWTIGEDSPTDYCPGAPPDVR